MIKPTIDYIFFQVDKEKEDEIFTKAGVIFLANQFEPGKHARIYGNVIAVPGRLSSDVKLWRDDVGLPNPQSYYSSDLCTQTIPILMVENKNCDPDVIKEEEHKFQQELYCPSTYEPTFRTLNDIAQEIEIDDRIYFHYNTVSKENRIETKDGNKVFKVRYDQVFCAVRQGTLIAIGGWVLIEAIWDDQVEEIAGMNVRGKVGKFGLITELHDKPKPLEGRVACIGTPIEGEAELDINKGDKVIFLPLSEFKNTIEGKEYYIMRQKDLIAKIV